MSDFDDLCRALTAERFTTHKRVDTTPVIHTPIEMSTGPPDDVLDQRADAAVIDIEQHRKGA